MYSTLMYKSKVKLDIIKPLYQEYSDAYILPCKFNSHKEWGDGGVLTENREFIKESGFYGWTTFGGEYEFDDYNELNEDVIWFGNFMNHWGHFLVDHVSRMWYLLNNYNNEYIVYVGNKMEGNFLEFFSLLGVKEEKILYIEKPTKVKKIIIPEYSFNHRSQTYKKEYLNVFDRVVDNALNIINVSMASTIYFSREKFQFAKQKEFGEDNIERIFNSIGYESLFPETMTLIEQIYVWNKCDSIVCVNGTIPLNICFNKNDNTEIIVLNKTHIIHENLYDFQEIFNKRNIQYIDVFDEKIKLSKNIGAGPFIMHVSNSLKSYFYTKENILLVDEKYNLKIFLFIINFYIMKNIKNTIKNILPRRIVDLIQQYRVNKAYNTKKNDF